MDTDSISSFLSDVSMINPPEISHLQNEILRQSQQIEAFIKSPNSKVDNTSLSALRSLFAIFKSELSVNITLRKVLVEEKRCRQNQQDEMENFFQKIHQIGYYDISNFDDVIDLISEQTSKLEKVKSLKKAFKVQIEENKNLSEELSDYKSKLSNSITDSEQCNILHTQINSLSKEKEQYLLHSVNLQTKLQDVAAKLSDRDAQIQTIQEQLNHSSSQFSSLLEEKNKSELSLNSQISELEQKLEQQKQNYEQKIQEINSDYNEGINVLKNKFAKKLNEINKEHKTEIEKLKQQIERSKNQLKRASREMTNNTEISKRTISELQSKCNLLPHLNDQIQDLQDSLSLQAASLKAKDEELQKNLKEKDELIKCHDEQVRIIKKLNSQCQELKHREKCLIKIKRKEDEIKDELRRTLNEKQLNHNQQLEERKRYEEQLSIQIESQNEEILNLRNQLRNLSKTLEKEEAELSRYQIDKEFNQHEYKSHIHDSLNNEIE